MFLHVNGGTITVDGQGDGIDVNGPIVQTGGEVLVHGPTSDMNGPLDYTGGYQVIGGTLIAAGSAGMAQAPDASSTQNAALIVFDSAVPAGTAIQVARDDGAVVAEITPRRAAASLVLSTPDLATGSTFTVTAGGQQAAQFTVAERVTVVGTVRGGWPMGGGGGGRRRP